MALILNGGTSNNPSIDVPPGTSLTLKTSDTAALTIDANQSVAILGPLSFDDGKAAVTTGKAIAMAIVFG